MKTLNLLLVFLFIHSLIFSQKEKSPEERAIAQTQKFAKELNLSEEQKSKFLTIQTGINQKMEAIRISKMNEDEKRNAISSIRDARKSMINDILNDEQKLKLTALEEKQKKKAKKKKKIKKRKESKKEKN